MTAHGDALDALVHAQTAGTAWTRLSWSRRMLLRAVGGRFTRYAVAAGHAAHLAAADDLTPLRRVPDVRLSRLLGGR